MVIRCYLRLISANEESLHELPVIGIGSIVTRRHHTEHRPVHGGHHDRIPVIARVARVDDRNLAADVIRQARDREVEVLLALRRLALSKEQEDACPVFTDHAGTFEDAHRRILRGDGDVRRTFVGERPDFALRHHRAAEYQREVPVVLIQPALLDDQRIVILQPALDQRSGRQDTLLFPHHIHRRFRALAHWLVREIDLELRSIQKRLGGHINFHLAVQNKDVFRGVGPECDGSGTKVISSCSNHSQSDV